MTRTKQPVDEVEVDLTFPRALADPSAFLPNDNRIETTFQRARDRAAQRRTHLRALQDANAED